jgi:hypothetical protein
MLFGRSGAWQNDADGERGGNEQSSRHRLANFTEEHRDPSPISGLGQGGGAGFRGSTGSVKIRYR